jgi:hypothetical protein
MIIHDLEGEKADHQVVVIELFQTLHHQVVVIVLFQALHHQVLVIVLFQALRHHLEVVMVEVMMNFVLNRQPQ